VRSISLRENTDAAIMLITAHASVLHAFCLLMGNLRVRAEWPLHSSLPMNNVGAGRVDPDTYPFRYLSSSANRLCHWLLVHPPCISSSGTALCMTSASGGTLHLLEQNQRSSTWVLAFSFGRFLEQPMRICPAPRKPDPDKSACLQAG
jgi:hypothetical protein